MKRFPKKEMDELISGVREWRKDEGNSYVHKPIMASYEISKATDVGGIKWLNLFELDVGDNLISANDDEGGVALAVHFIFNPAVGALYET